MEKTIAPINGSPVLDEEISPERKEFVDATNRMRRAYAMMVKAASGIDPTALIATNLNCVTAIEGFQALMEVLVQGKIIKREDVEAIMKVRMDEIAQDYKAATPTVDLRTAVGRELAGRRRG